MKRIIKVTTVTFTCILLYSCSEFLNIDKPKDQLVKPAVFTSDRSAEAALAGIYSSMADINSAISARLHLAAALCSDELYHTYMESSYDQMLTNNIQNTNGAVDDIWTDLYKYIYYTNSILEGLVASDDVSSTTKTRLTGEAKLVRALCFFYLCNLWGEVPLTTISDYRENESLPRSSLSEIYSFIIKELEEAYQMLSGTELANERTRPSKQAAMAFLARVHLFQQDWQKAARAASEVIESELFKLEDLSGCFLKDSRETIWQLAAVNPDYNTFIGQQVIPASETTIPRYVLLEAFANSIEDGDQRISDWTSTAIVRGINYRFPYKYKLGTASDQAQEFLVISRLAELYLIRAEALARLGNLDEAHVDLNVIRNRAGLDDLTGNSKEELLLAIEQERRVEFFLEWGHRWLDLKRTGRSDDVLQELKAPEWQASDTLWPIPLSQIEANPYLTQNPGY